MKKIITLLLIAVFAIACVACTAQPEASTEATTEAATETTTETAEAAQTTEEEPAAVEKETLVLGFSFRLLDEAMTVWWESTEAAIEEYNTADNPYTIEAYFTNAEQNVDQQLADVETLIVREPDAILIQCVDVEGSVPAYEAVTAAGIPLVDFGFGANYDGSDVVYKTINHYYSGQLQAEWVDAYLEANPEEELYIGYINGLAAITDMAERYAGFEENITSDRATILSQQFADFAADKALAITEDWIQAYPEINAIVSANDEMAVGGLQAMKAANIPVVCLGMDGGANALKEISEGYMSATIAFDFNAIAREGLDLAIKVAAGETVDPVVDVSEKVTIVIDETNISEYV